MYVSLNEFYWEVGLDSTPLGEEMGWHIDRGLIDMKFSTQLSDDDRPCLVVDYSIAPRYDYKHY